MSRTITGLLIAALFVLGFSGPADAADGYAKATKVGTAHAPGCGKGNFTDIKGQCWTCPKGYKHDNILLAPTHEKVCKKAGSTEKRKAKYKRKGGALGVKCKKGEFWSTNNGNCYKCAKGFKHNPAKFGNQKGVCYKKHKARFSKADKVKGGVFCKQGFYDPIDKGSCWTCPKGFNRHATSVKSDRACIKPLTCGARKQRPCLVTERIPSCDKDLYEDVGKKLCLKVPPGGNAWSATIDSMSREVKKTGKDCSKFLNKLGDKAVAKMMEKPKSVKVFSHVTGPATVLARGEVRYNTGFLCGIFPYTTGILDGVSQAFKIGGKAGAFYKAFEKQYTHQPCSTIIDPTGRGFCSIALALPAGQMVQCVNAIYDSVVSGGGKSGFSAEQRYYELMELTGNIKFSIAADAAIKSGTGGLVPDDKKAKALKLLSFAMKLKSALTQAKKVDDKIGDLPGCRDFMR